MSGEVPSEPADLRAEPAGPPPILSVVIASYNSMATIERCLRSLERQVRRDAMEIIVIDSSTDGTASVIGANFPDVRLLRFVERKFPGDARNIGVRHSHGAIIAFTDADCFVEPGWASAIIEAHGRFPDPVIGGAVENGNPASLVGWAHYFAEFSQWAPEAAAGHVVEIPTTCLTLKRWIFQESGPFLEKTYCSDSAFQWTVGRRGHRPLFLPSLRVSHTNITSLPSLLRRKAFHGTCFARVRSVEYGWAPWRRFAYALGAPVLPPLLFGRVCLRVIRGRRHLARYVAAAPLVLLVLSAWSWGELLGYVDPLPAPMGPTGQGNLTIEARRP